MSPRPWAQMIFAHILLPLCTDHGRSPLATMKRHDSQQGCSRAPRLDHGRRAGAMSPGRPDRSRPRIDGRRGDHALSGRCGAPPPSAFDLGQADPCRATRQDAVAPVRCRGAASAAPGGVSRVRSKSVGTGADVSAPAGPGGRRGHRLVGCLLRSWTCRYETARAKCGLRREHKGSVFEPLR